MRRELIFNALNHLPVKRVPTGFWFHFLPQPEKCDWRENSSLFVRNLAGHKAFIKASKPGLVKIMSDGFFYYPSPPLYHPEDLAMIGGVDPNRDWVKAQTDLIRRVREIQEDAAYFYNIFSPVTTLRFMIGLPRLKAFYQAQPLAFVKALERMAKGISTLARAAVANGEADGIYFSVQNPDQKFFSEDFYRKNLVPMEKSILAAAEEAGGKNILHICGYGGVKNNLALYADYPAVAVNWAVGVEGVSLGKGRAIFPGKAVIGGFDNSPDGILAKGSEEEVKAKARAIIREAGPLGLILGADCTLPSDIELERLEWVKEAGAEAIRLGGYLMSQNN
jgi:uroporphyrinogen decarboxylase